MRFTIFDTETTGLTLHPEAPLEQQPKIIEVGLLTIDENGDIISEFNELINPEQELEKIITEITGITDSMLRPCKPMLDWIAPILQIIQTSDVVCAHNLSFDKQLLDMDAARCGREIRWPRLFCTVEAYQELWGYRPNLKKLYQEIIGHPLAQTHRAIEDCEALAEIILKEELHHAASAPMSN